MLLAITKINAQPTFTFSSHTAQPGETVTVDFTVDDFEAIISVQFAIKWNSSVLEFQQFTNLNTDAQISMNSFSTPADLGGPPRARFNELWPEFGGISLPNGTRLFSIQFLVIGPECSESSVRFDGDDIPVPFIIDVVQNEEVVTDLVTFNDGLVDVPGEDCPEFTEFELYGNVVSGERGDEVCVRIGVRGFNDIITMQYSHNWDPALLEFSRVQNLNLSNLNMGNFEAGQASNGRLSLSYDAPGGQPISVPDNTIIYEICYEILGSAGTSANVTFSSNPIPIEFIGEVDGSDVELSPILTPGRVDIVGDFDGLTFLAGSAVGSPGDIICLDVDVTGFDNILAFQDLLFEWDPSVLRFEEISTIGLPPGFEANTNNTDQGRIAALWVDNNVVGVTLADNTTILSLCFEVVGECDSESFFNISGVNNGPIQAFDGDDQMVPAIGSSGTISIECECNINAVVTDASCFGGDNGSIELTLSSVCLPFDNIQWAGPTAIPDGEINPGGLSAGAYSVTVTYNGGTEESVLDDIVVGEGPEITIDDVNVSFPTAPDFNNGAISVNASGGSGQLSFDWGPEFDDSPEISGLESGSYQVTITDELGCTFVSDIINLCAPAPVVSEVNNVSCHGESDGSIELVLQGELEDYQISWSCTELENILELSDLGPVVCLVTIIEVATSCVTELTLEVTEPAPLILEDIIVEDDDGSGIGSIQVVVSGGVAPYNYNWGPGELPNSPILDNLDGGNYSLVVTDANGCIIDAGIINVPGALDVGANIQNVSCRGEESGSITIMVSGGSGDYSYQWICTGGQSSTASTIQNVSAGTCTVTITDNDSGVQVIREFEVTEPSTDLNFDIISLECNEFTNLAELDLIATGGVAPYQFSLNGINYQTSNSFSGLPGGSRDAFLRDDAGCVRTFEFDVPNCIDADCFTAMQVITPDGDGFNDHFVIKCAETINNVLQVFNRGGQLLFQQSNYRNDWEGTTTGGSDLDEGTYLWVFEVIHPSGRREVHRGAITILRNLR